MADLLSDYLEELELLYFNQSQAMTIFLLSLRDAIAGDEEAIKRVWEFAQFYKESLEQSKDLLQAAKAANRRKRKARKQG
jgi:hypothetical protein